MKKLIIVFLLLMFIPTIKVNAYCKNSDIAKYKGMAANINTSYDYKEVGNEALFEITLTNLNENLYIVDVINEKTYQFKNSELTISEYKNIQNVKYNVYATNPECNQLLYTIRVNLPKYNKYYKDEACFGIEDYKLCQKWYGHTYDHETFIKKIDEYKKSLDKKPITEEIITYEDNSLLKIIGDLFIKYYYILFISVIIVCSISIYRVNKKSEIYH